MATPTQPMPGNRPPNNPQDNRSPNPSSQNPSQRNPQLGTQGGRPQTAGGKNDDETKLPIGDTSGEMEDSGGGRKTSGAADAARPSRSDSLTTAPGRSSPVEPQKGSSERSDVERDAAASKDRSRSKQQGA